MKRFAIVLVVAAVIAALVIVAVRLQRAAPPGPPVPGVKPPDGTAQTGVPGTGRKPVVERDRSPGTGRTALTRVPPDPEKTAQVEQLCDELVKRLTAHDSTRVTTIGRRLVALGDAAVPRLARLLDSEDIRVSSEAMRLLGRIATAEATAVALGKLLSPATLGEERRVLMQQFSSIRGPAIPALLVKLIGDTDERDLLNRAGEILSYMEGPDVVDALATGIAQAKNDQHRANCLEVLAQLRKPSTIPSLDFLLGDPNLAVAHGSAAAALANIGSRRACEALVKHAAGDGKDVKTLLSALSAVDSPYGQKPLLDIVENNTYSVAIRAAAARGLGNYRSSDVQVRLANMASGETDGELKAAMDQSLQRVTRRLAEMKRVPDRRVELVERKTREVN